MDPTHTTASIGTAFPGEANRMTNPASQDAVLIWIGGAIGTFYLIEKLMAMRKFFSGRSDTVTLEPNPLMTRAVPEVVLRSDFERLDTDVHNLRTQMTTMESNLREEQRSDTADLHEKINTVGLQVSAQTAKLDMINQSQVAIGAKLDRAIESIHERSH